MLVRSAKRVRYLDGLGRRDCRGLRRRTQQPTKIMGGLTRDSREGSREKGANGECGGRRGGNRERRARGGG